LDINGKEEDPHKKEAPLMTMEKLQQMQEAYQINYPSLSYGNLAQLPEHKPFREGNLIK